MQQLVHGTQYLDRPDDPNDRPNGIHQVAARIKIAPDTIGRLCNPRIPVLGKPGESKKRH